MKTPEWLGLDDVADAAPAQLRAVDARRTAEAKRRLLELLQGEHAAQADFERAIDAQAGQVDAAALAAADRAVTVAADAADQVAAELARQTAALRTLEAKSAADLEGASLDDLRKIAKGRTSAADELRTARLVVDELERRFEAARVELSAARTAAGALRTAGLEKLADELAGELVVAAGDLADGLERLTKLQALIGERGGSEQGRVPAAGSIARRLRGMVAFYQDMQG